MFFSLKNDSRTRGHEVKLAKDQSRLDIRKYSFSQRTVNERNKLSMDCITASSVNMFKNKLDTHLRRAGYTYRGGSRIYKNGGSKVMYEAKRGATRVVCGRAYPPSHPFDVFLDKILEIV